jgi:transposase
MLSMPPSLVEWLPEDHLAWTVLGAVDQMDLDRFREGYRLGGAGRAPYDPAMRVALLLYVYARGNRSSRQIERACWEDVAYRRHETEIAELFDQVLGLCKEAGLVSVGMIMIDGTKIKANASMDQNRSYSGAAREILREAEETDRREDELCADARGDQLPEHLRTPEGRREAFAVAWRARGRGFCASGPAPSMAPRGRPPASARPANTRWSRVSRLSRVSHLSPIGYHLARLG